MTGRTAYVTHSDCSRHDTGWRHPEHQGRLPAVARAGSAALLGGPPALREALARRLRERGVAVADTSADMVVFLSSARANQVTGQTINVDGGQVMHW